MKRIGDSRGYSLIEVMIAMGIVTVGLLGLLALFTQAAAVSQFSGDDLIAKQAAREALESIYTARNTNQLNFSMIRNTENGGVFLSGFQPLREAGGDGLSGTADDGSVQTSRNAGPDGEFGTGDDIIEVLDDYEREVSIQEVNEDLRRVSVTVRYTSARGLRRNYTVSSYISRFR